MNAKTASANAAVAASFSQTLDDLGGISAERVCVQPAPGQATVEDLVGLSGGDILPGLVIELSEVFGALDRQRPGE